MVLDEFLTRNEWVTCQVTCFGHRVFVHFFTVSRTFAFAFRDVC